MPIRIKTTPEMFFKTVGESQPPSLLPIKTPIALLSTRAPEAAANIIQLLYFLSVAKSIVANWVLSPSSATNTDKKIVINIFKSICYFTVIVPHMPFSVWPFIVQFSLYIPVVTGTK